MNKFWAKLGIWALSKARSKDNQSGWPTFDKQEDWNDLLSFAEKACHKDVKCLRNLQSITRKMSDLIFCRMGEISGENFSQDYSSK